MTTSVIHRVLKSMLALTLVTAIYSCDKSEPDPEPDEQANTAILLPDAPVGTDAVLLCVRSSAESLLPGLPPSTIDVAQATFGSPANVDAGNVSLNNIALRKLPNFAYINGDLVIDYKIASGTSPKWIVSGGSGFDGFEYTTTAKIPGLIALKDAPFVIRKSADLSLEVTEIPANTTNIIWMIADARGNVVKKETNTPNASFSAADLSVLEVSRNAVIQVVAYNTESTTLSGKKYFFVQETMDYVYADIE